MHIGFRYHIASLIAVFFSLFLGILVGSILFQDDFLVQEQNNIIGELEQRFTQLENGAKEIQASLKQAQAKEQFLMAGWDQIRHFLIHDQLKKSQVVIISDQKETVSLKRLTTLVEAAGGSIAGSYFGSEQLTQIETQVEAMKRDELSNVVVVWVEDSVSDIIQKQLDTFASLGWQICILQPYGASTSLASLATNALVIDIGDTFLGEVALVWGLAQGLIGEYGQSKSATSLIPIFEME